MGEPDRAYSSVPTSAPTTIIPTQTTPMATKVITIIADLRSPCIVLCRMLPRGADYRNGISVVLAVWLTS